MRFSGFTVEERDVICQLYQMLQKRMERNESSIEQEFLHVIAKILLDYELNLTQRRASELSFKGIEV
jgi:hypothetical protein